MLSCLCLYVNLSFPVLIHKSCSSYCFLQYDEQDLLLLFQPHQRKTAAFLYLNPQFFFFPVEFVSSVAFSLKLTQLGRICLTITKVNILRAIDADYKRFPWIQLTNRPRRQIFEK